MECLHTAGPSGANESSVGQSVRAPSSGPAEQPREKGSSRGQKEVPEAGHKGRGMGRVGEERAAVILVRVGLLRSEQRLGGAHRAVRPQMSFYLLCFLTDGRGEKFANAGGCWVTLKMCSWGS